MIQDGEYLTAPQKPLKIIGEREACQVCDSYIRNLCIVVITENVMCVLSDMTLWMTLWMLCILCTMQRAKQMVAELIAARESGSGVSVVVLVRIAVNSWMLFTYCLYLVCLCLSHLDLELPLKLVMFLCARQTSVECWLGKVCDCSTGVHLCTWRTYRPSFSLAHPSTGAYNMHFNGRGFYTDQPSAKVLSLKM